MLMIPVHRFTFWGHWWLASHILYRFSWLHLLECSVETHYSCPIASSFHQKMANSTRYTLYGWYFSIFKNLPILFLDIWFWNFWKILLTLTLENVISRIFCIKWIHTALGFRILFLHPNNIKTSMHCLSGNTISV